MLAAGRPDAKAAPRNLARQRAWKLPWQLAFTGLALVGLGLLWQQVGLPFNKKIWTPSYVLFSTGWATVLLAALMALVEGRGRAPWLAGWARGFEVFGRNPLFIFVLSGLVPRVLALWRWPVGVDVGPSAGVTTNGGPLWTSPLPWLYQHVFAGIASDPRAGSLLYAAALLACYGALAWWLDHRRIYIRV